MMPEIEKQVYESFRDAFREVIPPIFAPADKMTDYPGGQALAMREMASACSPQTHRSALRRLCEKLEDLIDGRVSGAFSKTLAPDIEKFHGVLEKLGSSAESVGELWLG